MVLKEAVAGRELIPSSRHNDPSLPRSGMDWQIRVEWRAEDRRRTLGRSEIHISPSRPVVCCTARLVMRQGRGLLPRMTGMRTTSGGYGTPTHKDQFPELIRLPQVKILLPDKKEKSVLAKR